MYKIELGHVNQLIMFASMLVGSAGGICAVSKSIIVFHKICTLSISIRPLGATFVGPLQARNRFSSGMLYSNLLEDCISAG